MAMKVILITSVLVQTATAVIAVRQMKWSGKFRTAWGCIAFALVLMVERRLHRFLNGDIGAGLTFEVIGVVISLLMLTGIWGLRSLFHQFRNNEEELLRQQAEAEKLAHLDHMTLLPNRRGFLSRAHREIRRAIRSGRPISLLMIDLDNLKAINDTSGHMAGDAAITTVGSIIGDSLRDVDVAGRFGGDEFIILLPETPQEEAVKVAERLRERIRDTRISDRTASASIGIATALAPGDSLSLENLLQQADYALYTSKSSGRDRVTAATISPA